MIYICTAADIYTHRCVPEGLVLLPLSSGPSTETRKAGRWLILYSREANNSTTRSRGGFLKGFFLQNTQSLHFLACLFSLSNFHCPVLAYVWLSDNVVQSTYSAVCAEMVWTPRFIWRTADLLYIACALCLRIYLLCENDCVFTCFRASLRSCCADALKPAVIRRLTSLYSSQHWDQSSLLLHSYHTAHIFHHSWALRNPINKHNIQHENLI